MSTRSSRTTLLPSAVNRTLKKVREARAQGRELVSLLRGEPDFATPAHIVTAGERALAEGRTNYTHNQGVPELRRALAAKMRSVNNVPCDHDTEVLVTDGATLGMYVALATCCEPGDGVLLPDFVYDCYLSQIHAVGATPLPVRSERGGDRFRLTRDACDEAARTAPEPPKALLLNTPWNPVGTVMRVEELTELADFAAERDLFIIADEIYESIVYDNAQHLSIASLDADAGARTITVNSFSKTYAMTGWRLGYNVATPEVTNAMLLVLQQCSRGPATFVQHAGIAALEGPQDCVDEMLREYAARRQLIAQAEIPNASFLEPAGGFFALLDISATGRSSEDVADYLLNDCGVVTMPGSAYGAAGEGFLRVSFAVSQETLRRGLELITDALRRR